MKRGLLGLLVFGGIALPLTIGMHAQAQPKTAAPPPPAPQITDLRRDYGQNVAPVYEGWEPNADGTMSMYFGYMNRNWKEEVDIPVGPNNAFEPAPQDRGQPTHFMPRRQKQLFWVTVPKDYPRDKIIVWTLTVRGKTEKVPASLRPEQQIDVTKETATENMRPKIDVGPEVTATAGQPVTLTVGVTDDGIPKPRARRSGSSEEGSNPYAVPNVRWSKYRGTGPVTFSKMVVPITDGKATTTATFSQPGVYMVQAFADDGSVYGQSQGQNVPGFSCCWTTGNIKVTVK
jgi:hypothetical protein